MATNLLKAGIAEFLGVFTLTFLGGGAIIAAAGGLLGVALAHGLALVVMITALGHLSGAHFNPAVTLGLIVSGRAKASDAPVYIGAQLLGGVVAGYLLMAVFNPVVAAANAGPVSDALKAATPAVADALKDNVWAALLIEILLTFFLVLVVHGIVDERQTTRSGGLIIGLTVTADILMGGPLTGAAMNPARWFGTALPAMFWDNAWVYIVGPLLGGILAGGLYGYLLQDRPERAR